MPGKRRVSARQGWAGVKGDFFSILQRSDMIAIIDYGMGNLRSVSKAFEAVGHQAVVTRDPRVIEECESCRPARCRCLWRLYGQR